MRNLSKYIDPFQIIGFAISLIISIWLIQVGQDTVLSLLIGLSLAVLTQLFDLQARMTISSNSLENGIERAIHSLGGVSVRQFNDSYELYEYVTKRMREAKKTVDDITMGTSERERTPFAHKAYEKYIETITIVCSKKTIAYREVMSFPPLDHIDRAERMLNKNLFGYQLKYYDLPTESTNPPILQFMMIDAEEVIVAFYRSHLLPTEREVRLAIRHPDIVRLFQDYYDTIWHGAKFLKDRNKTELTTLQEIRKRLSP